MCTIKSLYYINLTGNGNNGIDLAQMLIGSGAGVSPGLPLGLGAPGLGGDRG